MKKEEVQRNIKQKQNKNKDKNNKQLPLLVFLLDTITLQEYNFVNHSSPVFIN